MTRIELPFPAPIGSVPKTYIMKAAIRAASKFNRAIARQPKWEIELACLFLCLSVATAGYLFDQVSLSIAYAVPVMIAAWYVGWAGAIPFAFLSLAAWLVFSYRVQFPISGIQATIWSGLIWLIVISAFGAILARLHHVQKNIEALAENRAQALSREIAERGRLEHEILEISEHERFRIGQDLHDGLCQHLAGTALASQLLAENLSGNERSHAERARKLADLTLEAIALARGIAKGLYPIEIQAAGLMQALKEFASTTSDLFGIACSFKCSLPVPVHSLSTATHLYRVAQEAVSNAIRHGHATKIEIELGEFADGIRLRVIDDGVGLPSPLAGHGMGLHTMAARAKFMGGQFSICSGAGSCGAEVSCMVPGNMLVPPEKRAAAPGDLLGCGA
jgi:signal transduction histidine kinase